MKRLMAITTIASLTFTTLAAPVAQAHGSHGSRHVTPEVSSGFTIPLTATSPDQGTFTGQLQIVRFAASQGQAVAIGLVTGTLVDENGVSRGIVRNVSLPVQRPASGGVSIAQCEILNLVLGPLDLDLLGLVVHLDQVVLDITAVPGAGNLLGNLLCAITNLLNGVGSLIQLINLLNQLLDLLTP
jgi:hypothetical protein